MPIGDPRDGFFYPTLTLMIDSYNPGPADISILAGLRVFLYCLTVDTNRFYSFQQLVQSLHVVPDPGTPGAAITTRKRRDAIATFGKAKLDKMLFISFALVVSFIIEPRRNKTCLRGIRQSETQTSLLSYRD